MSFSGEVRGELAGQIGRARHCQIAELAAMLHFAGVYGRTAQGCYTVGFQLENEAVLRKCFTILKKTFKIDTGDMVSEEDMREIYCKFGDLNQPVSPLLIKNPCCRRAFLRGAFLCAGSMSDPRKGYHLEFVCTKEDMARQLQEVIQGFEIEAKIVPRKNYYVVYLKEGSGIVDLLNVMGAHLSLMKLENLRILKEMRGAINRRVNCETANIGKTVAAADKQIEDILYVRDHWGLENLPENLQEMARVRLEYPEAPLKELGEMLDPPVGKSGVNHRLRRLGELAQSMRQAGARKTGISTGISEEEML